MIKLTLKDGSIHEVEDGSSVRDAAKSISRSLAKAAVAAKVDGQIQGMDYVLPDDCEFEVLKFDDPEGASTFRHTASHVLAQAVKKLWPEAKLAIGPSIENGFYYDFDLDHKFTEEDFPKIEKEMNKIVEANIPLERFELPREEAVKFMEEREEPYKVQLIEDLPEDAVISFYKQGDFTDLCAGPHLSSTGPLKAIKIQSVAGAYWRGDEHNKMLQRLYATAFPKKKQLDEYLAMLEEAKKRDHRKIGKEMDLFMLAEEGPGFPFFLPKGMVIRNELENFWRQEHSKRGYQEIKTPLILNEELWHRSGHWDHYQENMYFTKIDGEDYAIKPMNCPGAMLVYKRRMYSYRDLPLRIGELGQVHRHELSGALHGLFRVRTFTQDDAHIFMLPEQIKDEIGGVLDLIDYVYGLFGFSYRIELSTRPDDSMGTDEEWDSATRILKESLEERGIDYDINEGDGAFYGPKLDFHLRDSLGRTWQCGTIQLDFQMPQRFDITYVGPDGEKHRPAMIHRVIFGSIERFIGILTEHFAGKFPLWLAPVQVKVLTVTEKFAPYANELADKMREAGLRVEVDDRNEKIGYKIREARNERVSYIVTIGQHEIDDNTVSVRSNKAGDLGAMPTDAFIAKLQEEIRTKAVAPTELLDKDAE
ncbi:MAG: threonine--tRNA ligase [Anaerovoracaceae bacterium]|nr:threonine--tRNA ligase [Bacillota bacterium]MDY2670182.1 threonine--tRNA ligase [Anaerovoracaceae bacterium]